jgi:hypothetical protein
MEDDVMTKYFRLRYFVQLLMILLAVAVIAYN